MAEPTEAEHELGAVLDGKLLELEQLGLDLKVHTACVRHLLAGALAEHREATLRGLDDQEAWRLVAMWRGKYEALLAQVESNNPAASPAGAEGG